MAAHDGPHSFFSFSSGGDGAGGASSRGQGEQAQQLVPSGIVCSASLGGGSGAGGGGVQGPGHRFLSFPSRGYSFAAWLRLEDGRDAADQWLQPSALAAGQEEHPLAAAAATSAATLASDQAVYALLHQQQPAGTRSFLLHHGGHGQHLLQGAALAVRQVSSSSGAASPGGRQLHLVAHSWSPKHAEAVLPLQQPLVPGWHHLALTHSAGAEVARGRSLELHACI